MKCLFLDTSSNSLLASILDDSKALSESYGISINEHSKNTLTEIERIFKEANIEPKDIDKLFVVNGPGSFTGIRIGVTIVKVYAWTLNKTVVPVSSLKAGAISNVGYDFYVSIIDARRDCVYAGIYDKEYNNVIDEVYISIEKLNTIINNLKGSIIIIGNININDKYTMIPAKLDSLKIVNYYKDNEGIIAHELKPNYLKKVEAEEKLMEVV